MCTGGARVRLSTMEARTVEVRMIEVLAHGACMTYGRLPMGERTARASSERRTSSEQRASMRSTDKKPIVLSL